MSNTTDVIETKETTNVEVTKERIESLEEIIWGFELARFDSHSPEYHLSNGRNLLRQQYEASLTDPRRI